MWLNILPGWWSRRIPKTRFQFLVCFQAFAPVDRGLDV